MQDWDLLADVEEAKGTGENAAGDDGMRRRGLGVAAESLSDDSEDSARDEL